MFKLKFSAGGLATLAMVCVLSNNAARAAEPSGPLGLIADEPSYADLAAGVFDFVGSDNGKGKTGMVRGEFRYGQKIWYIGPAIGALGNGRGASMFYGGFYSDAKFGDIVITPFAGFGAYQKGSSIDLGGTFEFRLSLAAAYEFQNGMRLGLQFAHISNAGSHRINPGDNELLLTYAIPLSF